MELRVEFGDLCDLELRVEFGDLGDWELRVEFGDMCDFEIELFGDDKSHLVRTTQQGLTFFFSLRSVM